MGNKQIINLTSKKLLKLIRGEQVKVSVNEIYYDLDAQDFLLTGKRIDNVIIRIDD